MWRLPPLRRGDWAAIILGIALVVLVGVFLIRHPDRGNNFGFGSDWVCTDVPNGYPICVKKPRVN